MTGTKPMHYLALIFLTAVSVLAKDIPAQLPRPDQSEPDNTKPVKVYILSGQSNMVGMGEIYGGNTRWGKEFVDPVVSVYPGAYSADADYDAMTPLKTEKLAAFGGVKPTPFPEEAGTAVVRGSLVPKETGTYQFNPGYGGSTYNIMTINGVDVHRKEVDKKPQLKAIKLTAGETVPFKIIYLTRQANGLGWWRRTDIPGLLSTLVNQGKFPHLVDETGDWLSRNDVTYKGVISAVGQGPLKVGIQGNTIGPELQFGHIMGYYHDEPVLILKASIGNRGLAWDILPPGSKRYTVDGRVYAGYKDSPASWPEGTEPTPINWYAGKTYDRYVENIHKVLNNFDALFPHYKAQGFEIAGFVWWQGHKDGNDVHASRYEQNMVNLINAWRNEFNAPNAPWVIATVGFGGWKMKGPHVTVANAQLAVSGETGTYPEFKGNVLTVETRDFWRDAKVSPKDQDYHYNRNAETYFMVGDALGRGMVKLKDQKASK